jgi:hypothetical protein
MKPSPKQLLQRQMERAISVAVTTKSVAATDSLETQLLPMETGPIDDEIALAIAFFFEFGKDHPRAQSFNLHNVLNGSNNRKVRADFSFLRAPDEDRGTCIQLLLNLLLAFYAPQHLYIKHLNHYQPIINADSLKTIAIFLERDETAVPRDCFVNASKKILRIQSPEYKAIDVFLRRCETGLVA